MRVEAWLDQEHWTHGGRITCHPATRPSQFSDDDVDKDDDDDDSWEEDCTSPSQQGKPVKSAKHNCSCTKYKKARRQIQCASAVH